MTSEGAIAFATFAVTSLGIVAASLQPTQKRAQSVLKALVVIFVVGIGAWVCVKILGADNPIPVPDPPPSTTGATATATGSRPTTTYKAEPERDENTSTVSTPAATGVRPSGPESSQQPLTTTEEIADRRAIDQPAVNRVWEIPSQPSEGVTQREPEPRLEPAKPAQDKWTLKLTALSHMQRGDWPGAIAAWTTWIRTYAGSDQRADHAAYFQLGLAYEGLEDWSNAIHVLERANMISTSNNLETLLTLGRCYERVQRWGDALRVYDEALRIDPQSALAAHGRSSAQRHLQR